MSNRFLRRSDSLTIAQKLSTKAIFEQKLIMNGDRILIAASGGKDSTILAWVLSRLRPLLKMDYELEALHISGDFNDPSAAKTTFDKKALSSRLEEWNIPFTDIEVPIMGRLKSGRKMNCYWCSTQRRTELLRYAMEKKFNKIALGHHLDDIIETFFMNMMTKGTLSAMPILLNYRKYPISLIRPLAYLEEKQIIACASELGIMGSVCTCTFGANSQRREVRKKIGELTDNSGAIKRRILAAMSFSSYNMLIDTGLMETTSEEKKIMEWNAEKYFETCGRVTEHGNKLVDILRNMDCHRVLDIGCGTGVLTNKIAEFAQEVIGIDSSNAMIEKAKTLYPNLKFYVMDACSLQWEKYFNVIFSNAVFHFIQNQESLLRSIHKALAENGMLICEFGASGNIQNLLDAMAGACIKRGKKFSSRFFYPTEEDYRALLEKNGFLVESLVIYDLDTQLKEGEMGLRNWIKQIFSVEMEWFNAYEQEEILREIELTLRSNQWDGLNWHLANKRIKIIVKKM